MEEIETNDKTRNGDNTCLQIVIVGFQIEFVFIGFDGVEK